FGGVEMSWLKKLGGGAKKAYRVVTDDRLQAVLKITFPPAAAASEGIERAVDRVTGKPQATGNVFTAEDRRILQENNAMLRALIEAAGGVLEKEESA
ncbi:MAG: hypothetical protein VKL39_01860, partial [Leptolyngbyaceae bacterium]|nr:hypothetical protein [Leptolyngbyaceae bacterium]